MAKQRILVVDDEAEIRFALRDFLELNGYQVDEAANCAEAESLFRTTIFDLVTLDYAMPDGTALDLMPKLRAMDSGVPILLLTGHGSIDLAVRAIKMGAEQFLVKPVELSVLLSVLERVLENQRNRRKQLATEPRQVRRIAPNPFLGISPAIQRLSEQARRAAAADSPILIQGETGTGKSELAGWLHRNSLRCEETLVSLNCAGLSKEFLETELFGHEKGAFTGAVSTKLGLLEVAHRGTVFLDEIGDMDLQIQPKLLKVLEEKAFRRLGDVRERKVDIRLIAASHQDLAHLVRDKAMRMDLYYRISAIPLTMPSLRERAEDIPLLARFILESMSLEWKRERLELTEDADRALQRHPWPGNIRELKNVLERAVINSPSPVIDSAHLEFGAAEAPAWKDEIGHMTLHELERFHIATVLEREGWHVERAAHCLGIPRSSLYSKIKSMGLKSSRI